MDKQYALAEITAYLKQKIAMTNINNSKSNAACLLLISTKNWQEKLPSSVETAVLMLQSGFKRESSDSPAGLTRLTAAAVSIGSTICEHFGAMDASWNTHVRVGALYLEALFQQEFIDIYRDAGFSKYASTAPYIIEAKEKWADLGKINYDTNVLLRATSTKPISLENRDLVKLNDEEVQEAVRNEKTAEYKTAVEYLHQVGWKVNPEVHKIVRDNKELFTDKIIKVYDVDGKEYNYDVTSKENDVPESMLDKDGIRFAPDAGRKVLVNKAFDELAAANKKKRSRKHAGKQLENRITELENAYNEVSIDWNAKLSILKRRSKLFDYDVTVKKSSELLSYPAFYQAIELDWRSRAYFAEAFFNFQGSDIARGQLLFSEGKELTEDGLFWLAVHTAGCFNPSFKVKDLATMDYLEQDYITYLKEEGIDSISVDKMSLNDRVAWTTVNMEMIVKLADDEDLKSIVDMDAEKPVSAYSACVEWSKVFDANERGVPHISHLPIPIDGSNNGSQHYAAQSRDENAADFTGLIKKDIPVDFYLRTARSLIQKMPEWFGKRDMKLKEIRKGISKRASMVRLYSAGAAKIADNIYADCYKEGYHTKYNITMIDALELAKHVVKSIDEANAGASDVMKYLQHLASFELGRFETFDQFDNKVERDDYYALRNAIRDLSKSHDVEDKERLVVLEDQLNGMSSKLVYGNGSNHISWTTPAGFPVKYKAFRTSRVSCMAFIKGVGRLNLAGLIDTDIPDVRSYMSGISPSWIHSHDSSHMFLTINKCKADGIHSFGAIHDSFSTHASDVDRLLHNTKEAFIDMYDKPDFLESIKTNILTDKHDEFDKDVPTEGSLDLTKVRDSDFFFA